MDPPHAAAERQPGDPGVPHDPHGTNPTESLCRRVEFREMRTAVCPGRAALGINLYAPHARQVDDDPAVAGGQTGNAVAPASYGDRQLVFTREPDRGADIVGSGGPDDDRRISVDHAIPDGAGFVVAFVAGQDHVAGQRLPERGDAGDAEIGGRTLCAPHVNDCGGSPSRRGPGLRFARSRYAQDDRDKARLRPRLESIFRVGPSAARPRLSGEEMPWSS